MTLSQPATLQLIQLALREDAARRDVTSTAVIPPAARIRASVIAKAPGVCAGGRVAVWTFHALDPSLRCVLGAVEGSPVKRGQTLLTVEGNARSIFAAERTALNFVGHLSGIATLTHACVRRVRGTRALIYDTRKMLPGLRALEKYAVRVGGGHNHRADLAEAILIKTNHLKVLGQRARDGGRRRIFTEAMRKAREKYRGHNIEVEVANWAEFKAALQAKPDVVMLDNWSRASMSKAVHFIRRAPSPLAPRPAPLLEVSGGVTLANVRAIARTGVDRISIGRLTHSAPSLDVSLKVL